ncbi:MAG: DUF2812 domain-containing protein [Gordonia sp. (in: high G+C Gram-positive bacteria)]
MSTTVWLAPARHLSPENFELWLERKAAQGQILRDVDRLSPLRLKFDDDEPAQIRYVLDQRADAPADYFRFRRQRGWEHTGSIADLHVWRRPYSGERPAGFVGGESLTRRAHVLGIVLAAVAALTIAGAIALTVAASTVDLGGHSSRGFWGPAIALAVVGVLSAAVSLQLRVTRLRAARGVAEPTPAERPRSNTGESPQLINR